MTRNHIEFTCFCITVIRRHRVIQRQMVAGDASSDNCSVCCKDCGYRELGLLYIKESGTCHPFVELCDNFIRRAEIITIETLYHLSCRISEQGRLAVIPVSSNGVHTESLPIVRKYLVLFCNELLEIHQNSNRLTGNVPFPYPYPQSFGSSLCLPVPVQHRIFNKVRIAFRIHPYIRSYKNMMTLQFRFEIQGFGGNYRVNATNLVADLPTDFKQIVRS